MHESRKTACAIWKDKKAVLLLSTHARRVSLSYEVIPTIPHRNIAIKSLISTLPTHLEYSTHMWGVDVVDLL